MRPECPSRKKSSEAGSFPKALPLAPNPVSLQLLTVIHDVFRMNLAMLAPPSPLLSHCLFLRLCEVWSTNREPCPGGCGAKDGLNVMLAGPPKPQSGVPPSSLLPRGLRCISPSAATACLERELGRPRVSLGSVESLISKMPLMREKQPQFWSELMG